MAQTSFQGQTVTELSSNSSRVLIAPEYGARLLNWTIGEQPIIHWPDDAEWSSEKGVVHARGGNPILFPFIARHYVDGVLGKWRDEAGVVRDLPMHGFARDLDFEVVKATSGVLQMRAKSTDATRAMYPFDFIFDVIYELRENELTATFETTNTGDASLPYYAGHHFYFSIPHNERADWDIILPCSRWGWQNKDGSIKFQAAESSKFRLDDIELIDRFHLDFTEPKVVLQNQLSNRRITIDLGAEYSTTWYDVTTWTAAPEEDYFCIEPWLGLPNAIHHGHGLRHIAPGQSETATCRILASE